MIGLPLDMSINRRLAALIIVLNILVTACQPFWGLGDREKFMNDCLNGAPVADSTLRMPYCTCMFEKVSKKFKHAEALEEAEFEQLHEYSQQCLDSVSGNKVYWPSDVEKAFLEGCVMIATDSGYAQPEAYCACVLHELKTRYGRTKYLDSLSSKDMRGISRQCKETTQIP